MKSKNTILDVRDLQEVKPKYILDNLKGGLEIRFEDNIVVKMKMKDIVISRYYWEILYKQKFGVEYLKTKKDESIKK